MTHKNPPIHYIFTRKYPASFSIFFACLYYIKTFTYCKFTKNYDIINFFYVFLTNLDILDKSVI